jgi:succinyl-CoA synthetase beta subunit
MSRATTTLSESRSLRLLADHGVPVVGARTVATPDEAAAAAAELGFPVVAKLCGDAIAHKTERGLVRLRLGDEAAVRTAAAELLGAARPDDGDVELLIAPMLSGTRELIVGIHTDEQFGPTVMLGVGGILAEAVADVAFRLAPLARVDAEELIDDLGTQALLGPFRGEPAVDREALVATLLGLSALATSGGERAGASGSDIVSVDVNPLIVVDGKPIAVDALVEVRA